MVKVDRVPVYAGEYIRISTDNHWSDIICIRDEEKLDGKKDLSVSYSSGGANPVPAVELAKSMVEAWTEALKILEEKS
jgi:hypothetical protein